jgi:hypothetical protein
MAEIRRSWDRSRNEQNWKRGQRRRKDPNGCGMAQQGKQREAREKLGNETSRIETATLSIAGSARTRAATDLIRLV